MPLVSTQQSFGMEQPRHVFEHDKGDVDDHDEEIQYSNIDIYGQKHPIETDQMIQNKLRQFDAFLQNRIPDDKKKSVLDAQRKCPELLTDSLKLMFLRCECFNVEVHCYRNVLFVCLSAKPIQEIHSPFFYADKCIIVGRQSIRQVLGKTRGSLRASVCLPTVDTERSVEGRHDSVGNWGDHDYTTEERP